MGPSRSTVYFPIEFTDTCMIGLPPAEPTKIAEPIPLHTTDSPPELKLDGAERVKVKTLLSISVTPAVALADALSVVSPGLGELSGLAPNNPSSDIRRSETVNIGASLAVLRVTVKGLLSAPPSSVVPATLPFTTPLQSAGKLKPGTPAVLAPLQL